MFALSESFLLFYVSCQFPWFQYWYLSERNQTNTDEKWLFFYEDIRPRHFVTYPLMMLTIVTVAKILTVSNFFNKIYGVLSPYLATVALRYLDEWQTFDNSLDERKWEHRRNQHKVLVPRGFEPSTSRMLSKRCTIRPRLPQYFFPS